jgi:hypothetical protein
VGGRCGLKNPNYPNLQTFERAREISIYKKFPQGKKCGKPLFLSPIYNGTILQELYKNFSEIFLFPHGKNISHICKGSMFISFDQGGGIPSNLEYFEEYGRGNEDGL